MLLEGEDSSLTLRLNHKANKTSVEPPPSLTAARHREAAGGATSSSLTSRLFDSSTFTPRPNFTVLQPGSVRTHEPLTFCGSLALRRRLLACAWLMRLLPPPVSVRTEWRRVGFHRAGFLVPLTSLAAHAGADVSSQWARRHCFA